MSFQFNNNLFLRTLGRAFPLTVPDSAKQPLIPYFQYKIGPYQRDHFLYFRREPSWLRYKFEAFDKMNSMRGYDIPRFLDFHYSAYPDKEDFRRFLRYEITARVASLKKHPKYADHEYEVVLNWLQEQEQLAHLEAAKNSAAPVTKGDDRVSDMLEEKLAEAQRSFTGKIVINGPQQLERLIQLLIVVKDLRSPGKGGGALFSSFSTTDLAAILRQFTELREYKVNTLQKKITECNEEMRRDPRMEPLREALNRYFFGRDNP
jgi:hypothetical protein